MVMPDPGVTAVQGSRYMGVAENTPDVLHLRRLPTMRSWLVCVVFELLALVILVGYIPFDAPLLLRIMIACYLACQGPWAAEREDCWITHNSVSVEVASPVFRAMGMPVRREVYNAPVCSVSVSSEVLRYAATGHQVLLSMENGHELPLTTTCTLEPRSEHSAVAALVGAWLDVPVEVPPPPPARAPGFAGWLEHVLATRFRTGPQKYHSS